jgi:hypothetical protein
MTAEVAIMNQHALVLAADSATTVTMWVQGKRQTRYFKAANKLFQLANSHPVGLMIFGSASLQDVPWELIVKEFRKTRCGESSPKLADYASRFFEFVKTHSGLFPDDAKRKEFFSKVDQAAYFELLEIRKLPEVQSADKTDKAKFQALIEGHLQARLDVLKATIPLEPVTAADVDSAIAAHINESTTAVADNMQILFEESFGQALAPIVAEVGLRALMCHYKTYLSSTGVVVGGYGDDEFFPSFEVFECFGFLDRHFISFRDDDTSAAITAQVPAAVEPFATTSMINTFRMGMGPDVFGGVVRATEKALRELAETVRKSIAPDQEFADLEAMIAAARKGCTEDWNRSNMQKHYWPFMRVIASLPITDMAALAKSLIELESLKERVTDSSESVSGPIDVAAITKHDGFVWIERKHYFKPDLNPRFFARLNALR